MLLLYLDEIQFPLDFGKIEVFYRYLIESGIYKKPNLKYLIYSQPELVISIQYVVLSVVLLWSCNGPPFFALNSDISWEFR